MHLRKEEGNSYPEMHCSIMVWNFLSASILEGAIKKFRSFEATLFVLDIGGFHLNLLVFAFVYQFNSRIARGSSPFIIYK